MPPRSTSLWESIAHTGLRGERSLWACDTTVALSDFASGSALGVRIDEIRGRSVLVSTSDQLAAALALIEVDGIARRVVLCPPDLDPAHLPYVVATAEVEIILTDRPVDPASGVSGPSVVGCERAVHATDVDRTPVHETEWILFTSGTTGVPKMVVHTLATLTGAIKPSGTLAGPLVWATFYDIRRYGGLQILLRALVGGGSLVLSAPGEAASSFLTRARDHGVTHITGTPSHWRRALMSPEAKSVAPAYARLSGEIADQAVIDHLQSTYPHAKVAHAFASTEAGVAFEVTDGRAGFPDDLLLPNGSGVDLKVDDDTLRIRSSRTALRYLGNQSESLLDAEGFVDTGDVVERRGDRWFFVGRRGGIINVGGLKIHPEEVEAVINRHPDVRMSLVTARKNPITGAIVAAEVVLASAADHVLDVASTENTKAEILAACRRALPAHKVPASIRFVPALQVTPSGKLGRRDA
ncbi:MAG TPA: long-chain fatty acid--CoA ligase [Gemmatimonadaceae bacterium]|nr:long-chain fatty acid--CoA ligase [Gemmatimonadaceae bacterium]